MIKNRVKKTAPKREAPPMSIPNRGIRRKTAN
jgi:hypothetical protein